MHPLRVKICGVTRPADVAACAAAGADAVGINFHPASPRYVDPRNAQPLLRAIPPLMAGVGVFVGLPFRQVAALAYQLGLRGVQYHGEHGDPEDAFPFSYIPAFRVRDRQSLADIERYLEKCRVAGRLPGAILVDAHVEGLHGGTGRTAPWELLIDFRPGVPLILAGGLTPENVAEAVRTVRPDAVDVASGVEFAPGQKDPAKVRAFVANARSAAAGL
ncbi:MAG: phosphoribosylanthranilate isomerase [Zavarzinella sp.]|nr:phosphoribosylanthranilate isomerase [Zavarzinella sp.]